MILYELFSHSKQCSGRKAKAGAGDVGGVAALSAGRVAGVAGAVAGGASALAPAFAAAFAAGAVGAAEDAFL